MTIKLDAFQKVFPSCKVAQTLVESLNKSMPAYGITSKTAQEAFLAQYGHETMGFTAFVENTLYTSPRRLKDVFPAKFPSVDSARPYAGDAKAIANRVYANRYGNEGSGDGFKYRGRGLCHLTFLDNYKAFSKDTGIDVVNFPDKLIEPENAVLAGCWYWKGHNLNQYAETGRFTALTVAINGGTNGLAERQTWLKKIQNGGVVV